MRGVKRVVHQCGRLPWLLSRTTAVMCLDLLHHVYSVGKSHGVPVMWKVDHLLVSFLELSLEKISHVVS